MAGCATAIALAARGVSDVLVVDAQSQARPRIGEAIPPAAGSVLQRLGLWPAFLAQGHLPSVGSCASWGKAELGYNDFLLDRQGTGWHLDRAAFDAMLAEAAVARGATVWRGCLLRDVTDAPAAAYALSVECGEHGRFNLTADFLVDATGVGAAAVRRLGVARNQIDCVAVIGSVFALAAPEAVPTQALLEASDYGWWYAARLPGRRLIVALAVDPDQRPYFGARDTWMAALRLTRHVALWVDSGEATHTPDAVPGTALAPSAILSRVVGPRWLAVGDAASSYDPISSQGITKALCDGEAAAAAIADALVSGGQARLLDYQDRVFAGFRDYLRLRRHLYGLERRWPDAAFWRHRLFRD